ncbi:hypothetical protein ACA910_008847 [Epithemia clementina (nom. ined.)]
MTKDASLEISQTKGPTRTTLGKDGNSSNANESHGRGRMKDPPPVKESTDNGASDNNTTNADSSSSASLWLRIFHINDVYELDNLPSFKTLVDTYHQHHPRNDGSTPSLGCGSVPDATLVILAGDFLAPSLLSSLDQGASMVDCLNAAGLTHVCLGNHECDVSNKALAKRMQQSQFTWINSNMPDLNSKLQQALCTTATTATTKNTTTTTKEAEDGDCDGSMLRWTTEYDIVTVTNSTGTMTRRVALLGLLTNDPGLYRPGSFGNAYIEPIIGAAERMIQYFRSEGGDDDDDDKVDWILPLTHQSIDDDRLFAQHFSGGENNGGNKHHNNKDNNNHHHSFSLILGGHDHVPYHEQIGASQIFKVGYDAVETGVVDVIWRHGKQQQQQQQQQPLEPEIHCRMVHTLQFPPDPDLLQRVQGHKQLLQQLTKAKLFRIPNWTPPPRKIDQVWSSINHQARNAHPGTSNGDKEKAETLIFSTANNRIGPSTGTTALATMLRMGMRCQACFINAGCVRGNKVYNNPNEEEECSYFFTWNDLKTEMPFATEMTVTAMPGHVMEATITHSRQGQWETEPVAKGGYLHTCDHICYNNETRRIDRIMGAPYDPSRIYLVAHPIEFLEGIDHHQPLLEWWEATMTNPETKANGQYNGLTMEDDDDTANLNKLLHQQAVRPAKTVIVELFSALFWLQLGSFPELDQSNRGYITRHDVQRQCSERVLNGEPAVDLIVDNVWSVADSQGAGRIYPLDVMTVYYVAIDLVEHVTTAREFAMLRQTVTHVLGQNNKDEDALDPDEDENDDADDDDDDDNNNNGDHFDRVLDLIQQLHQRLDLTGDGHIQRTETMKALGRLRRQSLL